MPLRSSDGDNPERFLLKFSNVGIEDHGQSRLQVYYNQNYLYLLNTGGEVKAEVFNMAGQRVFQTTTSGNKLHLNLPAGVYFARIISKYQINTVKFFVGQ